jgi:hypothetical protein
MEQLSIDEVCAMMSRNKFVREVEFKRLEKFCAAVPEDSGPARAAVNTLLAEVRRLSDELEYQGNVLADADDYARKLTDLITKHFPGVEPGCIAEADARYHSRTPQT